MKMPRFRTNGSMSSDQSNAEPDPRRFQAAQVVAIGAARQALAVAVTQPTVWLEQGIEVVIWIARWFAVTQLVAILLLGLTRLVAGEATFSSGAIDEHTFALMRNIAGVMVIMVMAFTRWALPRSPLVTVWRRTYSAALYQTLARSAGSEDPMTEQ